MARKRQNTHLPTFDDLFIPTIQALLELGGSGTVEEINTKVYEIAELTDSILQVPHSEGGNISEVDYRLAWSRTYLKKFGLLENSSRAVWALLKADIDVTKLDPSQIKRVVREETKAQKQVSETNGPDKIEEEIKEEVDTSEAFTQYFV